MSVIDPKLQKLIAEVQSISPEPADRWEIAAILESLGYTDRQISTEFNYPDSLALGSEIYIYLQGFERPSTKYLPPIAKKSWQEDLTFFSEQFFHSFTHAVPFITALIVDGIFPIVNHEAIPVQLSALLTPATMASLVTSGGFVQMIQRRGSFYKNMNEPIHAHRACRPIFLLGIATSLLFGLAWICFGFYRGYAGDNYLIISSFYYVVLSIIWQAFAMVSLQYRFSTPIVLAIISVIFVVCRIGLKLDYVTCELVTMTAALIVLMILLVEGYRQARRQEKQRDILPALPRSSIVAYLLAPYFCYGIAYFGFLFTDRFAAGLVLERHADIAFAINTNYQHPMDIALLNFLLMMPLVEYLSAKFSRWWYQEAKQMTLSETSKLYQQLRRRYWLSLQSLAGITASMGAITIMLMYLTHQSIMTMSLTLFGICGYLAFAIGLWHSVILFVLNQMVVVLRILLPAWLGNFLIGYIVGNLLGVNWVPLGLLLSGIWLAIFSGKEVFRAMRNSDYCYFYSGY